MSSTSAGIMVVGSSPDDAASPEILSPYKIHLIVFEVPANMTSSTLIVHTAPKNLVPIVFANTEKRTLNHHYLVLAANVSHIGHAFLPNNNAGGRRLLIEASCHSQ